MTASRAAETSGLIDLSIIGPPVVDGKIVPGTVMLERYEILSVIGTGGMGTVYLAEHIELGRKLAIKILSEEWSTNRFAVRRFRAEARTAGSIGHANVIQVFDAGAFADGRLFLVMEHLEGRDLKQELRARRAIEPLRACTIMRQVGLALTAVHALGVIHRDLKPGNIMLVPQADGDELVKVLDFGIAANTAATGLHGERMTRPGWIMGTPEYMAPEQATGDMPSPQLDVYAFGVILFEMLTGTLPITAEHSFELLAFKRRNRAPSLRERMPELPDSLIELVDDCLEIDPERRPREVASVVARLGAVLAELRGEAIPVAAQTTIKRRGGGRAVPAVLGLGAAIVAVALLVGGGPFGSSSASVPVEPVQVVERAPAREPEPITSPVQPVQPVVSAAPPIAKVVEPEPAARSKPKLARAATPEVPARPNDRSPASEPTVVTPPAEPAARASEAAKPAKPNEAHATPRCERVRRGADEARTAHQWSALRNYSRSDECWADPREARKLQTKSMMELGDYTGCVSVGDKLSDPDVVEWVQLCRIRGGA